MMADRWIALTLSEMLSPLRAKTFAYDVVMRISNGTGRPVRRRSFRFLSFLFGVPFARRIWVLNRSLPWLQSMLWPARAMRADVLVDDGFPPPRMGSRRGGVRSLFHFGIFVNRRSEAFIQSPRRCRIFPSDIGDERASRRYQADRVHDDFFPLRCRVRFCFRFRLSSLRALRRRRVMAAIAAGRPDDTLEVSPGMGDKRARQRQLADIERGEGSLRRGGVRFRSQFSISRSPGLAITTIGGGDRGQVSR